MINRILIRIKVVQMVYSYLLTQKDTSLREALKTLMQSMDKSYELYHSLLYLPVELTRLQELQLDNAKHKYLPSEEDLNPNMKFVENRFVAKMQENPMMQEYMKAVPFSWSENEVFMRMILDRILNSEVYATYMAGGESDLAADCEFWRDVMRKEILSDENLAEILEEKSVFWNDDLDVIGTFVLKTIKRFGEEGYNELLPQFKDDEDREYAEQLFLLSIENKERYMELLKQFVDKNSWDVDRLAFMDVVILLVALAEVEYVPSVPTKVTLNEYIEIAKYYSTAKSGQFVNGILNSIIIYLKKEGRLNKN